ncbi:TolC family protein [Jhaorihella thermophila]
MIERQNEALYDRMAIIREVERLAGEAWSRHQSYQRVADLAARQVATNRELVDQYLVEFNAATRSLLDVLIAETELFHARLTQLNARAGALFSAYRILAAESRLAEHFGIDRTGELLALEVRATETQKNRSASSTRPGRSWINEPVGGRGRPCSARRASGRGRAPRSAAAAGALVRRVSRPPLHRRRGSRAAAGGCRSCPAR